jgi:hypothetical protein
MPAVLYLGRIGATLVCFKTLMASGDPYETKRELCKQNIVLPLVRCTTLQYMCKAVNQFRIITDRRGSTGGAITLHSPNEQTGNVYSILAHRNDNDEEESVYDICFNCEGYKSNLRGFLLQMCVLEAARATSPVLWLYIIAIRSLMCYVIPLKI